MRQSVLFHYFGVYFPTRTFFRMHCVKAIPHQAHTHKFSSSAFLLVLLVQASGNAATTVGSKNTPSMNIVVFFWISVASAVTRGNQKFKRNEIKGGCYPERCGLTGCIAKEM